MKLSGKAAIVTGASQGIGSGIALKLASGDASYITGENLSVDGGSLASMFHLVHQLSTV